MQLSRSSQHSCGGDRIGHPAMGQLVTTTESSPKITYGSAKSPNPWPDMTRAFSPRRIPRLSWPLHYQIEVHQLQGVGHGLHARPQPSEAAIPCASESSTRQPGAMIDALARRHPTEYRSYANVSARRPPGLDRSQIRLMRVGDLRCWMHRALHRRRWTRSRTGHGTAGQAGDNDTRTPGRAVGVDNRVAAPIATITVYEISSTR
jgi:hypothetical protein